MGALSASTCPTTSAMPRPSAQAITDGARVFGVMTGTPDAHRVGYLTETLPVSEKLLALAGSAKPTQLFRIAAPCANDGHGNASDAVVAATP